MAARTPALTLRDLFWLVLVAAVIIGWGVERTKANRELQEFKPANPWSFEHFPRERPSSSEASTKRLTLLAALQTLSADQLLERARSRDDWNEYQCLLTEMARRKLHPELRGLLQADEWKSVELLTALRRAEGKPDPVQIKLQFPSRDEEGKPLRFAKIETSLVNLDPEWKSLSYSRGGDYRGGRSERWRVELTDSNGKRVPDSNFASIHGGGLLGGIDLDFGQPYESPNLYAQRYVATPAPGQYQLQVFHSQDHIADDPGTAGLILLKSEPMTVVVKKEGSRLHISALPLLGVFAVGALGFVIRRMRRRKTEPATGKASTDLNWRDWLFGGLVLFCLLAWNVDVFMIARQIVQLRPDWEIPWTIEVEK